MGLFDRLLKRKKDNALDNYINQYEESTKPIGDSLGSLFNDFTGVNEEFNEKLTETLLQADVGIDTTLKIVDGIQKKNAFEPIRTSEKIKEVFIDQLDQIYDEEHVLPLHLNPLGTTVFLIVGVNGVGKTTSIAKIGKYFLNQGKSVLFVAGDTFRAGAREQLQLWANRLGVPCVSGKDKADPSSVIVDGCQYALAHKIDIVLCDTAGRLQNKNHLMQELEKMHRVIGKTIPGQPMESLLVLDATTGQNGLSQAQAFYESAKLTGIILSKFDGTGRGGIVLTIKDKWNLPVRFVGIGEQVDDLREFHLEDFAYSLWKGIESYDS